MKLSVLDVARVAHEANRALCQGLGDTSHAPFDQAPTWQVESLVKGVEAILDGHIRGPQTSHELWLETKKLEGWKYGPVKDPELKTHPCFLPFEQLPLEDQRKDFQFLAIVTALAPLVSF